MMLHEKLLLLLALLLVAWVAITYGLHWYGWRLKRRGRYATALTVADILWAIPSAWHRPSTRRLRAYVFADSGRTDEAVAEVRALLDALPEKVCYWPFMNTAVDIFVNAGLYNEAATVHRRWSVGAQEAGRKSHPTFYELTRVNRAEALHNLGRDREALSILDAVDEAPEAGAYAWNGGLCLQAWIHAASGNAVEARKALSAMNEDPLAGDYLPELRYTRSLVALVEGAHERALADAQEGLSCARRASSYRNGLFLIGKLAHASGDLDAARKHLEQGAAHSYRAQAADGLFMLASVYAALGMTEARDATLQSLIERDAESHLATRARELLALPESNANRPSTAPDA